MKAHLPTGSRDNVVCAGCGESWPCAPYRETPSFRAGHKRRGGNNGRAKLTAEDVIAIRVTYRGGNVSCAALANQYGVNPTTVYDIVTYRNWKSVP